LLSFSKLAEKFNYSLVYCNNNGVNCFFVNNDILQERGLTFNDIGNVEKLYRPAKYSTGPNGGHPQDPYNRKYISFEEAYKLL
jgi:hypothetical protein